MSKKKSKPKKEDLPLNENHLRFCEEFLIDLNRTQAAVRAGYSADSAAAQGCRMLSDPRIQLKVQELMAARSERVAAKSDQTLIEINHVGHSDIRKILTEEGTIKPASEWPEDIARAVASIEIQETFEWLGGDKVWSGYLKKIKLWDKPKALDMKARHEGLYAPQEHELGEKTLETLLSGTWTAKPKEGAK